MPGTLSRKSVLIISAFLLLIQAMFADESASTGKSLYDISRRTDQVPLKSKEEFVKWRLQTTYESEKMIALRWDRAKIAIQWRDLTNPRVLEAFLRTPRELFVGERNLDRAYDNAWLFISYGVTISGPHIVARMTNVLNLEPEDKVLEIGTGSGYQATMLAQLTNHVYTIEIIAPLAKDTDKLFKNLESDYPEVKNIHRKTGDGYYGWQEEAPFNAIIVTCGIDHVPPPLLEQLKTGGIMVIPVGAPNSQTLLKVTKQAAADGSITINREDVYNGRQKVKFIPFTADGGKGEHSRKRDIVQE